jgi:hypothetical protein
MEGTKIGRQKIERALSWNIEREKMKYLELGKKKTQAKIQIDKEISLSLS